MGNRNDDELDDIDIERARSATWDDLSIHAKVFLLDLRKEEVKKARKGFAMIEATETISWVFKWFVITVVGAATAGLGLYQQIKSLIIPAK